MTWLTLTQHARDPTDERRGTARAARAVGSYRIWLLLKSQAHTSRVHSRQDIGEIKQMKSQDGSRKLVQVGKANRGAPQQGQDNTKGPYRGKEIGRADLTASTPPLP